VTESVRVEIDKKPLPFSIRPSAATDQEAINHILQATWADDRGAIHYFSPGEDFTNHTGFRSTVVIEIADRAGPRVAGFGMVGINPYHPSFAYLILLVHPAAQHRGVGSALYEHLMAMLAARTQRPIKTATYENQEQALAFLHRRGFRIWMRTYLPVLQLADLHLASFTDVHTRITAQGYQVYSMAELAQDPTRDAKLADLHYQVYAGIHLNNPPAPALYERRFEAFLGGDVLPEAMYIAAQGAEYVAVASLRSSDQPETLEMGWCGTLPAYRQHADDLVLALTLHGLAYAQKSGIHHVMAEVDEVDQVGMALLERLPFESRPVWLTLVKE
jgi:mycothiol synthase